MENNTPLEIDFRTALIIDDEVELCMMIKGYFKKKNRQVDFSTNLKDGLLKFEENQPDILILDHNLPDGQGISFIRTFIEKTKGRPLYIIVISAMSNLKFLALENGADDFLTKPITFNNLNEILQKRKPKPI